MRADDSGCTLVNTLGAWSRAFFCFRGEAVKFTIPASPRITSIFVKQTKLRIIGNSNKLVYFRKLASRIYSTKPLHI